jgi:hypothetical protein
MVEGGKVMYFNVYQEQLMADERVKDALRKAEQARLVQMAKGSRQVQSRRPPVGAFLSSLLAPFTQSQRGPACEMVGVADVPNCC